MWLGGDDDLEQGAVEPSDGGVGVDGVCGDCGLCGAGESCDWDVLVEGVVVEVVVD